MSKLKPETIRSDFLIHWTGKDIEAENKDFIAKREKYVERLRNTLIGEYKGLWMNKTMESIVGGDETKIEYGWTIPVTCFSEIKLSDVYKHTERYGHLGFGFNRDFVIKRFGAPVQYVSGTEMDTIVECFASCWKRLESVWSFINSSRSDVLEVEKIRQLDAQLRIAMNALHVNISFIKNMSDPTHPEFPNDFSFLDEAEWRIVKTRKACYQGLIKELMGFEPQKNGSLKNIKEIKKRAGEKFPEALIPFEKTDLKVLIFPDSEVRKMSFADPAIQNWFGVPLDLPVIATVEECLHF